MVHLPKVYSPECVEGLFFELRVCEFSEIPSPLPLTVYSLW